MQRRLAVGEPGRGSGDRSLHPLAILPGDARTGVAHLEAQAHGAAAVFAPGAIGDAF